MSPIFALIVLLLVASVASITDEQALHMVKLSCHHHANYCPNKQYLLKIGSHQFDEDAFMHSKQVRDLQNGEIQTGEEALEILKAEFCCDSEECLKNCGLFNVPEKDIVLQMPKIYKELFGLGFEELKQYETDYVFYLKNKHHHHNKTPNRRHRLPAEIEELYDLLHENEEKYRKALKEKHGIEF